MYAFIPHICHRKVVDGLMRRDVYSRRTRLVKKARAIILALLHIAVSSRVDQERERVPLEV